MHQLNWWFWVFLAGLGLVGYAAGLGFSILLIVAISWLAVTLIRTLHQPSADSSATDRLVSPPDELIVDGMVAHTSTEMLCELWTKSNDAIRQSYLPSSIGSYANLRATILTELTRRDPESVDRWLNDRPAERDPSVYLRDRHGRRL